MCSCACNVCHRSTVDASGSLLSALLPSAWCLKLSARYWCVNASALLRRFALCVLRVVFARLLLWDPLVQTCRRCSWNERARCVRLCVFMIGVDIRRMFVTIKTTHAHALPWIYWLNNPLDCVACGPTAGYSCLQYRRVPKFCTYCLVCCACTQRPGLPRSRVTAASSPASHCKQCSARAPPSLHTRGCATSNPSRSR